jgi:hypothetical protein
VLHYAFWWGLAGLLFAAQLWHLTAPVHVIFVLVFAGIGLCGIGLFLWHMRHSFRRLFASLQWVIPLAVLFIFTMWGISRAANAEAFADDGLYHLQEIRWANEYAIVPGLANVHSRFGFNNAFALIHAAFDALQTNISSYRFVNLLCLCAFFVTALTDFSRLYQKIQAKWSAILFAMLLPGVVLHLYHASTAKNDLITALLMIVVTGQALDILQNTLTFHSRGRWLMLSVTCASAITIKLSAAPFIGLLLIIVTMWAVFNAEKHKRWHIVLWAAIPFMLILSVWMLRGVILSGYPLYPQTIVSVPVAWRLSDAVAQAESDAILGWARTPKPDWRSSLNNWSWLSEWFTQLRQNFVAFIIPVGLHLVFMPVLIIRICAMQPQPKTVYRAALLWIATTIALIIWFVTAPDSRFAWSLGWISAVILLIIVHIDQWKHRQWLLTAFAIVLIGDGALRTDWLRYRPYSDSFTSAGLPEVALTENTTYHGIRLLVPSDGLCWDTRLPCAPHPIPYLQMRDITSQQAGFTIQPIEPDKGAYHLTQFTALLDIVPPADSNALYRNILNTNGILLGQGWGALEETGQERYRWVEDNAYIYLSDIATALTVFPIILDIEPGPSLNGQPLELLIFNEGEILVEAARVTTRGELTIDLPLTAERVQIFRLSVANASWSIPAPNDGRILNFRVMQITNGF